MNKLVSLSLALFISISAICQDWQSVGPFYGKSTKAPYMHSMGLVDAVLAHPTDVNSFLMATNSSGIWKTTSGGKYWKCMTESIQLIPGMGIRSLAANPKNPNQIVAAAGNYVYGHDSYLGGLLVSNDWGDTWELNDSFSKAYTGTGLMKVLYSSKGDLYVLAEKRLFVSKDNGSSFTNLFQVDDKND